MTGIHSSFSIVQPYPRGDGKTGLGTQSLFQTINWYCARSMAWCRAALVGGNLSDSACLLNNDHLSSLTALIVAFGWYSWQTNCSIPSRVSSSGFLSLPRLAKNLRIDSLASSNSFQQVGFPFPEKLPVLSAPVKAWNAGSAIW